MAVLLARSMKAPSEEEQFTDCPYEVTDTGNNSMKVVVRVRPESEAELRSSCHCVVKVLDEHVLIFDPAEQQATARGAGKEHDRGGEEGRWAGRSVGEWK